MPGGAGPVTWTFRVRYSESDQMDLAHHGAYVTWLEAGRIEWLREHGFSYRQLETEGVLMPVIELALTYRKPLRFDDEVDLTTQATVLGRSRVAFQSDLRLRGEDTIRSTGRVVVACVGPDGRPRRLPDTLTALLPAADATASA